MVTERTLRRYAAKHPVVTSSVDRWIVALRAGEWATMDEVVRAFANSKAINGDRARFQISGGDYRLIVSFNFGRQWAFVKFIGTHAEYDRIDAATVAQF
ncbi:MAG TPA: type II toxin-antitoxin system HigB family toxin [Phenylobacterium sp.]